MSQASPEADQILQWVHDNESAIIAIGSIGSLVCGIATLIGVIVAGCSLAQTNKQLEATTVYNIQKDGRELLQSIQSDGALSDYLFRYNSAQSYPPELKAKADRELAIIMQFYTSISNQKRNGIISESFWADFERDFCNFLRTPPAKQYWDQKVLPGAYDDYFKEVGQRCLGRQFIRKAPEKLYFRPTEK
jgi:hypothetical protein